jgi:hypothetical protein
METIILFEKVPLQYFKAWMETDLGQEINPKL